MFCFPDGMAEFRYKARDASGGATSGTIAASSRSVAAAQLRSRGLIVVGVERIEELVQARTTSIDWSGWLPPRSIDVELSLQQLAMMLRGGMTLIAALTALSEQASRRSLGKIWQTIVGKIQTGENLSTALTSQNCFPDFVVQMVRVGERTGELVPVLQRSIETMRSRRTSRQEVVSALIYPVMVILVAIGVTIYMIAYLIPKLELYLQSLSKDMPVMTQRLVDLSAWLRDSYALVGIVATCLVVITIVLYNSREGRIWMDRILFNIPVVGRLLRLSETSTFARSLSMMLGSGITLVDSLGTVEKLLHNRHAAKSVLRSRDRIIQGGTFADSLNDQVAFSPMLKKMVAVGQQSGDMRSVLQEVADYQDDQLKALIKRLNAIITPVLTVGVGIVVGYVYIAFFVALLAAGS